MKNSIEILGWDSNFFKKKIGRVTTNINNEDDLLRLIDELDNQQIDLAYYASSSPLPDHLLHADRLVIKYVDRKITYEKPIDTTAPFSNSIISYEKGYPEPQLIALAIESGVFSRFKVDKKIGIEKFAELYKTWIVKSVNKQIAKEVLVYREEGNIAGFVTLGEKDKRADIGIIAVEEKHRGKGIGKSLMTSAEKWFADSTNFDIIQVVTQGANVAAGRLYESCGYSIGHVEHVYHFWKNDNI